MGQTAVIYGLDIETDTSGDGWDPAVASVRTVALSCRSLDEVFTGDEATLLAELDHRLATLPPGIIATWNGSTLDLPFIADRARLLGVDLSLRLCLDRRLTLDRAPLPGHAGAYRGAWGHHAHLDTFRLYGQGSPSPTWTSLRTIGRLLGLGGLPRPRRPDARPRQRGPARPRRQRCPPGAGARRASPRRSAAPGGPPGSRGRRGGHGGRSPSGAPRAPRAGAAPLRRHGLIRTAGTRRGPRCHPRGG